MASLTDYSRFDAVEIPAEGSEAEVAFEKALRLREKANSLCKGTRSEDSNCSLVAIVQ